MLCPRFQHDKLNQPLFCEAPMSLELAAQHLASRGRKGDTMLVHMAPQEVSGLQALAKAHGGTLTVNPDTGLPEANFLKRLLPTLIGAGLMFATGGAAAPGLFGLSNAATIGLGVGGLETLRTGNLGKGLMAGLGAYGGAGLTGGLMGAGAATTGNAAASSAFDASLGNQGITAAEAAMDFSNPLAEQAASGARTAATSSGLGNLTSGAKGLLSEQGRNAALNSMGGGMQAAKYGLAAASPMLQPSTPAPYPGSGPNPYEYDYDPNTQRYTRVAPGTRQRDILAPTTSMMAMGGPVDEMSNRNQMETMMANGGQMYAAGGISHLGDYSDGGRLLKGPGDGVSDSIPATIANKRPARLADGEFVVPARIVSELGNGSTEAGARKLYAMMARVQKARGKTTGKNRVAVNSRTEKLLPA
jgi:hypothetical protein